MRVALFLALMVALTGCAAQENPWIWRATVTPTNDTAKGLVISQMVGVDGPEGVGPVRVTLADGRVLKGLFRLEPPTALPTSTTQKDAGARQSPARGLIQAGGSGIRIICEAQLTAGHGTGTCFTTTKAEYRMRL